MSLRKIVQYASTPEKRQAIPPFSSSFLSEQEQGEAFLDELYRSLRLLPDYRKLYHVYGHLYSRCLEQKTAFARICLIGPFAKTDYLLKEYHAAPSLCRMINDTRVRLRKRETLPVEQLTANYTYDLKALALFVAAIYDVALPADLIAHFPPDRVEEQRHTHLLGEYLRLMVTHWDDAFIYGEADDGTPGELQVCYTRGHRDDAFDWSYLKEMLFQGCQLNLVRPRLSEGTVYPELIIYEPDYLVDISSVAACFESYADSPLIHLLNKIKPAPLSEAIVLGNLASQLLDEEIHGGVGEQGYSRSVQTFFKKNALSVLAAGIGRDFHLNAQTQKLHIHMAVGEELPQRVGSYRAEEVMLEPSFFSEMLGLQGRMDLLQLDHRLLVEQKSGKGGYPQPDPDTPAVQEKHYVQMLLYMALLRYNYREQYERNNRELNAFLLYSRYKNSLLGLGFAPELLFRAVKVRNGIAWSEFLYSRGGIRVLGDLTADDLNLKHASGTLWERYQKPQIEALLRPVRQASDLERAYYFRFLTFVENEHLLSKIGNRSKECSGFASKWHESLEEKLQAGNIYADLTLSAPQAEEQGGIEHVELSFKEKEENDMANFRTGDIVILYPYETGQEPDARSTMVFRCSVEEITVDRIRLQLRSPQADARVFMHYAACKWAIEHDFYDSSYAPFYRGMHAFLSAPHERRDLLLLQRAPQVDETRRLQGDYEAFNELALRVKQADDLFLIIGPPGTGKTSFGLLTTLKEELLSPDASVLLLAYTNRAVDEICGKLVEEKLDFLRIGSHLSSAEAYHPYLLGTKVQTCRHTADLNNLLLSTRIIVGTTASLNGSISLFGLKTFTLAIIDEASQILEPYLMGILSARHGDRAAVRKLVLIGDHKQLPAVVQQEADESRVDDPLLNNILLTDCRQSLFERLLRKYRTDKRVVYMLTRQGRMHHDIAQFPNKAFYQNSLTEVPLPHQRVPLPPSGRGENSLEDLLQTRRIAFLPVPSPEVSPSDKVNQAEADVIASLVLQIYRLNPSGFQVDKTVGVIVPYRNQIATVRNTIDRWGIPELHRITIDTVERYQGSQRDYILYGFTVQKPYQLEFLTSNVFVDEGKVIDRKLNVAMTRAREHLFLIGNPVLLRRVPLYASLMESCECVSL
ncbi:MAG: AAA family ATPase [Bacteroides sp.]|nr:AAA family ATPase [Bacteroides sp.]